VSILEPERDKHSSLQDKTVPLRREREAIEQPLERISHQYDFVDPALAPGEIQEPLLDRRDPAAALASHWTSAPPDTGASSSRPRLSVRPPRSRPALPCVVRARSAAPRWPPSGRRACCERRRQVFSPPRRPERRFPISGGARS